MNAPRTIHEALARLEAKRIRQGGVKYRAADPAGEGDPSYWDNLKRNAKPVPADKIITREEMGKTWL